MSGIESATGTAARRAASGAGRVVRVWKALPHERRLAAVAALGLFVTLFLPWYQETVIVSGKARNLAAASASLTGWGAFSFVEAAVLLVAAGVLTLLFQRAEGRAFHLPGGDGGVITAAGAWTCVLVIWRIFDKQGTSGHGQFATTSGIEWGILIALAVAVSLTYAGTRIRAAHRPEPPLPGEPSPAADPVAAAAAAAEPIRPRPAPPARRPQTDRSEEPTLPRRPPDRDRSEAATLPRRPARGRSEEPTLFDLHAEPTLPLEPREDD